ncbi:hypothetical protein EG68_10399 [Paragonimus skrjabini miyazakii]|uniref:CCD97-like C-terminal domain-containing protein n=1 Tax=Paragonimus skrjabini miyazakii TaxID=59628 RepID=A0A8S9YCK2_9TREM|nr:hypothetical protein EG68_10399 [Paragonimus skrjabini miyazakii]
MPFFSRLLPDYQMLPVGEKPISQCEQPDLENNGGPPFTNDDVNILECPVGSMEDMFTRLVSMEHIHFGTQTLQKHPLTDSQKLGIARDLYTRKPGVFLERFGPHLRWPEDRIHFLSLCTSNDIVRFLVDRLDRKSRGDLSEGSCALIRNRRWNALRCLESGQNVHRALSEHFTHRAMCKRDPSLWDTSIGQHLDDASRRKCLGPDCESVGGLLTEFYEQKLGMEEPKERYPESFRGTQPNGDHDATESDDSPERKLSELEFVELMKLRFVAGDDQDFDYSQIDDDDTLDDHVQMERDIEERYFDAD